MGSSWPPSTILDVVRGLSVEVVIERRRGTNDYREHKDHAILLAHLVKMFKVLPADALSALQKLSQGDLKGFIEIYVDPNICPSAISLCRDRGPRIKFGILINKASLELYSECFDVELLLGILLGDLASVSVYEEGHRNGVRFKRALLPLAVVDHAVLRALEEALSYDSVWRNDTMPRRMSVGELVSELASKANNISELIMLVPCVNATAVKHIAHLSEVLAKGARKLYVIASPPSPTTVQMCKMSYGEALLNYVSLFELKEQVKEGRLIVCDDEIPHVGFIINRTQYLLSSTPVYRDDAILEPIPEKDYTFSVALNLLRRCLCTLHLLRGQGR